jgi:hypothetical protein
VRAWVAAAAILALQLAAGCTIVTVGEPVGEVAPLSKKLKWQGIWLANVDNKPWSVVVVVDDADKGALQICGFWRAKGNKRPPLDLHCFSAQVRLAGGAQVLHVAADEFFAEGMPEFRDSLKGRWLIVLLQHRGERVLLWLFEDEEVATLIQAGKLSGKVIRSDSERFGEVRIDRLEPELLKRWISEDARKIMWKAPIIFDYHPMRE